MVNVGRPSLTSLKETVTAAYTRSEEAVAAAKMAIETSRASQQEEESAESRQDEHPSSPKSDSGQATRPLKLGSFDFGAAWSFPPLFHEADDMLNLSLLIYTLVDLRNLARDGGLGCPETSHRILEVPLPLKAALDIMAKEGETLKQALDDGEHEATLSALKSLLARQREAAEAMREEKKRAVAKNARDEAGGKKDEGMVCGSLFGWIWGEDALAKDEGVEVVSRQQQEVETSMITAVGDLKNEEELVYAVGVNPIQKRITVTFRGSVTKADFMTDAKIRMAKVPDPLKFHGIEIKDPNGSGDVGIHQGFYEYLFGGSDDKPSKYMEIMNHIDQLLEENPDRKSYKLYVSGHSLGGALSTLFGFFAVGKSPLPLPVSVVSVASPRVGNINFARTFLEMESQGRLRHLRIANHQDPVTLGPTVSSKRALALSAKVFSPLGYLALALTGNSEGGEEEVYYHTGIKMELFKSGSASGCQQCTLSYSGAKLIHGSKSPDAIDGDDVAEIEQSNKWKRKEGSAEFPMVSYHFGTSYAERMVLAEPKLKGLTLNDLYQEKAFGRTLALVG